MTALHTTPISTCLAPTAPTRWIGGVVRPHRCKHRGKPLRVAAWITSDGSLLGAVIVEGHGPTVLRELLDDLLARAEQRPHALTVWPSERKAFADLEYPIVTVERDGFLAVVIGDHVDFGDIPGSLPVR